MASYLGLAVGRPDVEVRGGRPVRAVQPLQEHVERTGPIGNPQPRELRPSWEHLDPPSHAVGPPLGLDLKAWSGDVDADLVDPAAAYAGKGGGREPDRWVRVVEV